METTTYYEDAEQNGTQLKAHGGMVVSAIGATLAMLPIPVISFLSDWEIVKYVSDGLEIGLDILLVFGILLWGIGQMSTIRPMKYNGRAWAPVLAGIFLFIYFMITIIFLIIDEGQLPAYMFESLIVGDLQFFPVFVMILFIGIHIVLICSTGAYSRVVRGMTLAKIGYWIILITPIALIVILAIVLKNANSYYGYYQSMNPIIKIGSLFLFIADVMCVIGWWIGAGAGIPVGQEYLVSVSQARVPLQSANTSESVAAEIGPDINRKSSTNADTQPKLSLHMKEKLMAMDDERLKEIADNPDMYTNKAYVDEAAAVLKKRRAWELIHEKSDKDLLEIVNDVDGIHEYAIRDAASMELFMRQSPEFVAIFSEETPDSLKEIVENSDDYFDGYVSMARKLLGME